MHPSQYAIDLKSGQKMLQVTLTGLLVLDILTMTSAASVCPGEMKFDVSSKKCVCPRDMFYDKAVKLCTNCFQICFNAELPRTEYECRTLCPDYVLPVMDIPAAEKVDDNEMKCRGDMYYDKTFSNCTCPKDMYYDEVARICSECYVVCLNAEIQMTVDTCKSLCPNYHLSFSTTSSPPARLSDLHKDVVIIAVVLSATIFICLIAITVYCYREQFIGKVQSLCSMIGSLLPCIIGNRTGDEVDHDKDNMNVQLAITGKPKETCDNMQPHDKVKAGPIIPSGSAAEMSDQETQAKVALLSGAEP